MSWGVTLAAMVVVAVAVAIYVAWPLLVGRPDEQPSEADTGAGSGLDELLVQKDATYSAIKELEFDHAMGNLSREDYRQLAARYEDKAVALLKTIDEVTLGAPFAGVRAPAVAGVKLGPPRGGTAGDAIERQVAALRRTPRGPGGRGRDANLDLEIEQEVAGRRAKRQPGAGGSGPLAEEIEQQVAALRGTKAGAGATVAPAPRGLAPRPSCPGCGAAVRSASAAFCSRCGTALGGSCPACGAPTEAGDAFCSACGLALAGRSGARAGQTIPGGSDA